MDSVIHLFQQLGPEVKFTQTFTTRFQVQVVLKQTHTAEINLSRSMGMKKRDKADKIYQSVVNNAI